QEVTAMAAADHQGPVPDLYQLLGVPREASREQIAQAWRRRARAEHPDSRPGQPGEEAAGRFRALAGAWRVLGDPARRAAYDRALGAGQEPGMPAPVPVPVRRPRPGGVTGPVPGPPLRAGPVRVDGPGVTPAGGREDELRLALLAALALRRLARDRGRGRGWDRGGPW
ncbi:MAG TPA: J domain-containing protein, partial [Streptosporangiaceae bacterium]|nr:J domain-containing protein [Streptosporangiaceae bacterium]